MKTSAGWGSRWPLMAAVLLVLSVGLPWQSTEATDSAYIPGYYVRGACVNVTDFTLTTECPPGFVGVPLGNHGYASHTGSGAESIGRFGVAWALTLIVISKHRKRPELLLWAGLGIAVVTGLSSGYGARTAGVVVAWMAAAMLIFEGLRARKLLKFRAGSPSPAVLVANLCRL